MEILRRQSPTADGESSEMSSRLQSAMIEMLKPKSSPDRIAPFSAKPWVVIFLGVNGVGKTTTIGKLAAQYQSAGKKVLLVAADTFRAAAIEQLDIWAHRVGVEIVKHRPGADPSAVVFDGMQAAKKRAADVVLIDTAGRLHTKVHLLEELKKIRRVIAREQVDAPHETLLVLDATTGQNGLQQARIFKEATDINGIVLTKLDGTAKGGVIISIQEELGVPVKYVGVGEEVDDLQRFEPERFVEALFEN
jgi:fused signal recognition particle receptor